jgi:GNAT superfamily N-acetyltransferase
MIEIRPAESDEDIAAFLAVRGAVDPDFPMTRESFDAERTTPGRLDVVALADGECAGGAFVERQYGDPKSTTAGVSVRVLEAFRRRGIGTQLLEHVAAHAKGFGAQELFAVARTEATSLLAFYAAHGFVEVGRMQEVELFPADVEVEVDAPPGVEIAPLGDRDELERGMYEVAKQADADVPAARPVAVRSLEQWRRRNLAPLVLRELSFVALEGGDVVGYAILGRGSSGDVTHWMTGVRRDRRGRGIATALKRAQIAGARAAGIETLRTQNDLGNDAMRRVNEKLGFRSRLEWVQMEAPIYV